MDLDPVHDRAHGVLADAEVQHPAVRVAGEHLALPVRSGRKLGSPSGVVLFDSARSADPPHSSGIFGVMALITLPDAARVAMPLGSALPAGQVVVPARAQLVGDQPVVERLALRVRLRPSRRTPAATASCACWPRSRSFRVCAMTSSVDLEGLVGVEAQHLLGRRHLLVAERGAVRLAGALQLGGRPADDRAQLDEARLVGDRPAPSRSRRASAATSSRVRGVVVGPVDRLDVPAVRGVARGDVLGQGDVGVVLDGDPVAVVDQGQVAQPLGAGQRGRLAS